MKFSRRALLAAGLPLAGAAMFPWARRRLGAGEREITGRIVGTQAGGGHLLLGGKLPAPSAEVRLPVAILGGGVAGLSAAWKLARSGFHDFRLFEIEPEMGGTSRGGRGPATNYPWGSHYIPIPGRFAKAVKELFVELGVIRDWPVGGEPVYDERYLCFAPQERLFIHGRWQEGLFPSSGASATDLSELDRFRALMNGYRHRVDGSGRPAFALPLEYSSRDPELLELDTISMAQFLDRHGFKSPRVRWYVEYGCRDDYGCTLENTSAWANILYYAARPGSDQDDDGLVLTWPDGVGWIVARLVERLGHFMTPDSLVCRIEAEEGFDGGPGARVDVLHLPTRKMTRIHAKHAIVALPQFAVKHVLVNAPVKDMETFSYAPWVVANVSVDEVPQGRGVAPAWDNVIYPSKALGYVIATHQALTGHPGPSVLTWYNALCYESPADARTRMLDTPWEEWRRQVLADLSIGHPGIAKTVSSIDVILWAHAMVRPSPGIVWGEAKRRLNEMDGPILLAHSDMSGVPLFEEAQYRAVRAAEKVLTRLGVKFESSLA